MPINVIQPPIKQAAVTYDGPQNLTLSLQLQARQNISAASVLSAYHTNPNICYNWNFKNAIHQEYDTVTDITTGYVIDGWKYSLDAAIKASQVASGLTLTAVQIPTDPAYLLLPIELPAIETGCTYTLSLLYENLTSTAKLVAGNYNPTSTTYTEVSQDLSAGTGEHISVFTFDMPDITEEQKTNGSYFYVGVRLMENTSQITLKAIKLEQGNHGTLLQKWIVSTSPVTYKEQIDTWDYQRELLRCQRYYVKWVGRSNASNNYIGAMVAKTASKNQMRILVNLPTQTRVKPATTISGIVADSFSITGTEVTLQEIAWGTLASDNYILLLNLPEGSTFADTDLSVRFRDASAYVVFDARI